MNCSNGAQRAIAAPSGSTHTPISSDLEAADITEALSYAAWRAEEVEVFLGQQ